MTAIYGFIDNNVPHSGFLASDDLEYSLRGKKDKISILENRYAVAITGVNVVENALYAISYLESFDIPAKSNRNIDELAIALSKYTNKYMEHTLPKYLESLAAGKIRKDQWETLTNQSIHLIVLDYSIFQLYEIDLGKPFSAAKCLPVPIIRKLENGYLHLFALARQAAGTDKEPMIYQNDHESFLNTRIAKDRLKVSAIGNLGCRLYIKHNRKTIQSCFLNPDDVVDSMLNDCLGFDVKIP
jgi:hypothetical protein